MIPALVVLVTLVLVVLFIIRPLLKRRAETKHLLDVGQPEVATVVEISQTGFVVNEVPEMRLVLDIQQAGELPRRVTTKQFIDLGSIPRAGDLIYILVDPANPESLRLAGAPDPSLQPKRPTLPTSDLPLTPQQTLDAIGLSPSLREHGILGIATVVDIKATPTAATQFQLEVDAINLPRRPLTITQVMYGDDWHIGDRLYILSDPADPNKAAILPLSLAGGQKIPAEANRLDALVLGPQILREGAKAKGTILDAQPISIHNLALTALGYCRFHIKVHIVPDNGDPAFEAEQDMSFINRERANRITALGAVVPIRYDAHDPHCFVTDAIALGYGDPYVTVIADMKKALAKG